MRSAGTRSGQDNFRTKTRQEDNDQELQEVLCSAQIHEVSLEAEARSDCTRRNHKIHALQLNNLIASFRAVLKAAKGKKKLKSRLISDANTVSKNYYI